MARWYYSIDGRQSGPVDVAVLKRLAASGTLRPQDKVRRDDLTQWYPATQIKGLFAAQSPPLSSASREATASESTDTRTNLGLPARQAPEDSTPFSAHGPVIQSCGAPAKSPRIGLIKRRTIGVALGVTAFVVVAIIGQKITPKVGTVSMPKGQFRTKFMSLLPRGCPGIAPENDLVDAFGKPARSQTLGDNMYWYWECTDGTMQVVLSYLQNVELRTGGKVVYVSAINDY